MRKAALASNVHRQRAFAARVRVWRDVRTGEHYLVDSESMNAHGPVVPADLPVRLASARACWVDEFLEVHWGFLDLPSAPLQVDTQKWDDITDVLG